MGTARISAPEYSGATLSVGSRNTAAVRAIQERLNTVGCGPLKVDGVFGTETLEAVELFQARSVDSLNRHLTVDGKIGPVSWSALFGVPLPEVSAAPNALAQEVLGLARKEIGVLEEPPGSNRGERVDEYLRSVGLDPTKDSYPWCAAFIYWCYSHAAQQLGVPIPIPRTARVVDLWAHSNRQGLRRISAAEAAQDPSLVRPGSIFVLRIGADKGHTGLVETIQGVQLTTIEGNTNEGGSREGIGVFRRTSRRLADINLGFIECS